MNARAFTEKKLCLATHNPGKLAEFQAMFAPLGVEVVSSGQLGLPEPEETGTTFEENALLKARAACAASGLPAMADDSGLCVHALDDAPGLYSARWAGESRDFRMAMARLNDLLVGQEDRSAHFTAVLALIWPDGEHVIAPGRVDGVIAWPPRGEHGHGYDPVFQPNEGDGKTFAEMTQDEKAQISHRGRAFRRLCEMCFATATPR